MIGMRRFRMVLLILVLGAVVFALLGYLNPQYTKTLKYQSHSIKYRQYLFGRDPFFGDDYEIEHAISNYDLFEQANFKLASRLCKYYRITGDSTLAKKIQMIAKEHIAYKLDLNIDSLLKYSGETFDTIIQIE
jgi:hypothetical protein